MTGVTPLKTAPTAASTPPRRRGHSGNPVALPADSDPPFAVQSDESKHIHSEDGSSFRKNGVQVRVMQKLKRGRFSVDDQLDLHNMTTRTAHSALLAFIADAHSRSLVSVRIIHGKGLRSENGPRLKLLTRQLLREHPQVLAYTTCKPADGGDGAVDILLKSS